MLILFAINTIFTNLNVNVKIIEICAHLNMMLDNIFNDNKNKYELLNIFKKVAYNNDERIHFQMYKIEKINNDIEKSSYRIIQRLFNFTIFIINVINLIIILAIRIILKIQILIKIINFSIFIEKKNRSIELIFEFSNNVYKDINIFL